MTTSASNLYEIRVQGHLDKRRIRGFDEVTVTHQPDGETIITGPIPDQSALYGLLNRLRDLGIPLVAVNRLKTTISKAAYAKPSDRAPDPPEPPAFHTK